MADPRFDKLADVLIGHSTRLASGEHVLIEAFDIPEAMVVSLVRRARDAGGHPHVVLRSGPVMRALIDGSDERQLDTWADVDLHRMKRMAAYIGLRGAHNVSELAGVDDATMRRYARRYQTPVHGEQRVKHTRWCVLRWPTPAMAQLAGQPTEAFEDFYFKVCTLDYARMTAAAAALADALTKARRVRIQGPGDTDLSFSIEGIPGVACTGHHNIPDGECFTAPVRDSVEGVVHFNTPTIYLGRSFSNIRLVFRGGKVVEATADQGAADLPGVLDSDAGSRFLGEFAVGFNPCILSPMRDILFDEKIAGSLHMALGRAYDVADNGNRSDVHWDLVLIQRAEYGGGRLYLDDRLVRSDGLFVVPELEALNPGLLG